MNILKSIQLSRLKKLVALLYNSRDKKYLPIVITALVTFVVLLWFFWISVLPSSERIIPFVDEPASFLVVYYWLLATALLFAMPLFYYMIFVRRCELKKIFLVSAFVFGVLYMFVYLPHKWNDEPHAHIPGVYQRAAALLGRESFVEINEAGQRIGHWRHHEDFQFPFASARSTVLGYYYVYSTLIGRANPSMPEGMMSEVRLHGMWYFYAPQVVGLAIGQYLELSRVGALYLGRLFALAAFIGIVYLAISVSNFKTLFVLLGITPALLVPATTFGYDSLINALSFLFIALIIDIAFSQKKQISNYQFFAIFVLGVLIAPYKYIYFPLLALPLIIPKEQYTKYLKKTTVLPLLLLAGGLMIVVSGGAIDAIRNLLTQNQISHMPTEVSGWRYATEYFRDRPARFFAVFTHTFFYQAGNIFIQLRNWDWNWWVFPIWIHIIIGFMLLASISPGIKDKDILLISTRQKTIIAFIAVAVYCLGILAIMSMSSQGDFVLGRRMQPRYFVPIVPLLVIPFYNVFRRVKPNDRLMIFVLCIINAYGIIFYFTRSIFTDWVLS